MEYLRAVPDTIARAYDRQLERVSDSDMEQMVIGAHQALMIARAPGKYDGLIKNLNLVSNFNPVSRIFYPVVPRTGAGLYPDAEVPYYFGRITDDIVDKDVPLPDGHVSIPDWITVMKEHVQDGGKNIPKAPTIDFLLKRTIQRLEPYPNLDIRHELTRFLNSMQLEYDRRVQGVSLTQNELWSLYQEEFGSPHTIMLTAFRSRARENDIPELAQILGRRYTFDGLANDLNIGIIGIPSEILGAANISDSEAIRRGVNILTHPIIAAWKKQELSECDILAQQLVNRPLDLNAKLYIKNLL